ncbi:hypothetical protein A1351_20785 [Methylosinus sp. R-45379]|nr:hypothetical protein A1351_20785 [Methylosinus sp. R-45379]
MAAERAARDALAERRRNYASRQLLAQPLIVEAAGRAFVPVGGAQTAVATTTAAAEKEEKTQVARRKLVCLSRTRPMSEF